MNLMLKNSHVRFKVNVQVIDNTGSTTFVLFDRVVSQAVRRSAQDFIDSMGQGNNPEEYPSELNVFVDKKILFKVEVSDNNLYCNWRNYTIRKLTMDKGIINQFLTLHGINVLYTFIMNFLYYISSNFIQLNVSFFHCFYRIVMMKRRLLMMTRLLA